MKDNEIKLKELESQSNRTNNKVIQLETEMNKSTVEDGFKSNDNLARHFNLYSMSDKAHSLFIDAIAKHLRIYNTTSGYKDEYINVKKEVVRGGEVGIAVYYSPKTIELIQEFLDNKFKLQLFEFKRGDNKGAFKESVFTLDNKNYKFNDKTYSKYK